MGSEWRRLRAACAVALTLATLAPSALASPTAADKERAREYMAQGRTQRDEDDLQSALKSFQNADAIMRVPTTAFEVAKTQQMLGLLLEARETLIALHKLPSSPSDPKPFKEARAKAEALEREIGAQIPSLQVRVTANRRDLKPTITIDEQPVPTEEGPRKLNPGQHVVVARGGGAEADATVTLEPGENKELQLHLETRVAAIKPPAPQPQAEPPPSKGIHAVSWVGFGLGAAGLIAGSVTGYVAISQESELADQCTDKQCPRSLEGDLDEARTMATISTASFIAAGVGVAVGVIGLVVGRSPGATTGKTRAPEVSWSLRGAALGGTF